MYRGGTHATANQIRGLLAEFGGVIAKGVNTLKRQWITLRQCYAEQVPGFAWEELDALYTQLHALHKQVLYYERKVNVFVREGTRAPRLTQINGIGPITASAIVATVGNAQLFKNGRQFAVWLGLTPQQHSMGGRSRLGRISKRGDVYLRTLWVHGARSELRYTSKRLGSKSRWAERLKANKSWNKSAVALANKYARTSGHYSPRTNNINPLNTAEQDESVTTATRGT